MPSSITVSQTVKPMLPVVTQVGVGLASICIAMLVVFYCWNPGMFQKAASRSGPVAVAESRSKVHSLGRLEPEGTIIRLEPPSGNENARVEKLHVVEGEDVDCDQIVAIMDTHERRCTALKEAEANLAVARARLAQTLAGSKPGDIAAGEAANQLARSQQKFAARDLERAEALQKSNAIAMEELDSRRWAHQRASLEVARTQALLESLKEVRNTDVDFQTAQVKVAESALQTAQANLEATVVRAKTAGRILRIHAHPGEKATSVGILEMGAVKQMQAIAEVYEADATKVHAGQSASIEVDCSGQKIRGVVQTVGTMVARKSVLTNDPVSDTDARVVEVRIKIDPLDAPTVVGLSNARIEVSIEVD